MIALRSLCLALVCSHLMVLPTAAVEPLHRVRERPPATVPFHRTPQVAQASQTATPAAGWLQALERWLRQKRGGSWAGALGVDPSAFDDGAITDTGPIATERLRHGDELVLRFVHAGCFGHFGGDLRYDPTTKRFAVLDTASAVDPFGLEAGRVCSAAGLGVADLPRIDALLEHLRANQAGGCTSATSIEVQWLRRGQVIAREHYKDASCALPAGALDLGALWAVACGMP
ncbi:MAG: hypothetical protein FJ100_12450 [Deltaproteobacteria bacterium]|nr:hypothetical protein [Deltaproteobacteria bacterium]